MKEEEWHSIEEIPPEQYMRVKDEFGNEATAMPTWYPFKVIPIPPYTAWSSKIELCEPYWDGGWLIECEDFGPSVITGRVTHWKI